MTARLGLIGMVDRRAFRVKYAGPIIAQSLARGHEYLNDDGAKANATLSNLRPAARTLPEPGELRGLATPGVLQLHFFENGLASPIDRQSLPCVAPEFFGKDRPHPSRELTCGVRFRNVCDVSIQYPATGDYLFRVP